MTAPLDPVAWTFTFADGHSTDLHELSVRARECGLGAMMVAELVPALVDAYGEAIVRLDEARRSARRARR